ncbi:ATP-grasp domain-containing protein [Aliarcobacter butzleri]|uniref:ATP-grasp domain-containing protein n=1 Tax=Aliarcobacter butzleri TaxID=28197 RepID=UPI0021B3EED5|nr:ATP-grasp domain-containing protein [Aliarcobacter butzleri]MCT7628694.1 ATP-grasp domain-containing protein [Aliarcobacter butzleri]
MKKNILITSISSKNIFIETVKKSRDKFDKNIKVFGTDISSNILGKYFVDKFFIIKAIKEIDILEFIDFCKKNKIAYIIPTRDEDVLFFAKNKSLFIENNISIFTPDFSAVELCFDKYLFVKNNQIDFNIKTALNIDDLKDVQKFVVKDRFGSGSKNIGINLDYEKAKEIATKIENPIFQEFIAGDEYSIDSYITKENIFIGMIIRKRELVYDGEAVNTFVVKDKKLEKLVKEFLTKNNISGHSITQVIKKEDNYYLVECNTRFGGASTLSYKMGLKSFYWFLCEENGIKFKYKRAKKSLRQIRVKQDIYFEN